MPYWFTRLVGLLLRTDGVLELEDPKSWPWPLTVLALASKWSGLGLDASASSHWSVINVLNL